MVQHYSNAEEIKRSILWQEHLKFEIFYLNVHLFDSSRLEQKHEQLVVGAKHYRVANI